MPAAVKCMKPENAELVHGWMWVQQCMSKGPRADLFRHALLHVSCHDCVDCHYGRLDIAAAAQKVLEVLLCFRPVTLHFHTWLTNFEEVTTKLRVQVTVQACWNHICTFYMRLLNG